MMRANPIILNFGFCLCLQFLLTNSSAAQEIISEYKPTRLIVKFTEFSEMYRSLRQISVLNYSDKIESQEALHKPEIFSFFNEYKISSIKPAKPFTSNSPLSKNVERVYFIDFQNNNELEKALPKLKSSQAFEYVKYDWLIKGDGIQSELIPNDPNFDDQWGFKNTGQNGCGGNGLPGADINITGAWDITTGSEDIIVAILDSGMPLNASEFSGRVISGYDFANDDDEPTDDHGHGTNVTSILAATGNNNHTIAGVDWNCKIMPIKILDEHNIGYGSWWWEGILMAVDNGARVLNMSVGGEEGDFTPEDQEAVEYAISSGSIIVACMMNYNNEVTQYPAAYDNVISVGALNNVGERAHPFCWGGGSNYGNHIDFVAPGDNIIGLNYSNPNRTSYWSGTSMATPMVSGLISLMLGLDPSLDLQVIYNRLKDTAHDQIGPQSEDTPGWDKYYGWGRIDAYLALSYSLPVELSSFSASIVNKDVKLNWRTETEINNYGFEIYRRPQDNEWKLCGFIEGHGNSNSPNEYSYIDKNPIGGSVFKYRLKQIDNDGTYKYSDKIEIEITPSVFALNQNYPNPFNPSTIIRYQLPQESKVILTVYDILGAKVAVLLDEKKEPGVYEINFNADHLPNGTYIYRIVAGSYIETKKMILLK